MEIALVFPRFKYPSGDLPLGLAYLASLTKNLPDAHLDIIDTTFLPNPLEYLARHFSRRRYDVVGISAMTSQIRDAFSVARLVRKQLHECMIVLGGPHSTVLPEHALSCDAVDIACIGEGERTWPLVLENLTAPWKVPGLACRRDEEIFFSGPGSYIEDLDTLPHPAYDLFDMKRYLRSWAQVDAVSPALRGVNIIASRGCPFSCSYCQPTLRKIFGDRMRFHSPGYIVDMLNALVSAHGINAFFFQDDTLNARQDWVRNICRELRESRLGLLWGCNLRADLVELDLLKEMKNAGLRKVNLGIESASDRILSEVYQKRITVSQVRRAVRTLKSLDLRVHGYFMLGAPTETREEIEATIRLSRELDLDDAMFSVTTPLPGTCLHQKTHDLVKRDYGEFDYYKHSVYDDETVLKDRELKRLRRRAIFGFYLSPKRFARISMQALSPRGLRKMFLKLRRL